MSKRLGLRQQLNAALNQKDALGAQLSETERLLMQHKELIGELATRLDRSRVVQSAQARKIVAMTQQLKFATAFATSTFTPEELDLSELKALEDARKAQIEKATNQDNS